ncbi:hypothetical protein B0J14DRAFT_490477 [Halenospora varia]|nr:hypothetical protein B0J14DRAFT_490477 [Halenospora varia]
MGCYPELLVEVGKHLRMRDFMILFCISKDFNFALRTHWKAHMLSLAAFMAPESSQVFRFNMYRPLCILDPLSRTIPHRLNEIQVVPGIKWLQMVVHREKASRDILACMARQGHRMPGGMGMSLKKMWLLMDMATNRQRVAFMRSSYWGWEDLYNVQMFVVKLDMRFNDPIDGPASDQMRKLFLGQRGLSPLWRLLKRTGFRSLEDVIKLSVRYNHEVKEKHKFWPIWEIPPHEIGIGHLEGWGKGNTHLYRPDELVVREAIRRRMNMKHHIMMMMLWGYCDPITGENTPPTEKEMYMSDDEERGPPAAWNHYEDPTPEEVEKFEKEKEQAGRDEKDARKAAIAAVEAKKVKEEEAMDVDDMMEERAEADDDFDNDEEMFDENMDM